MTENTVNETERMVVTEFFVVKPMEMKKDK